MYIIKNEKQLIYYHYFIKYFFILELLIHYKKKPINKTILIINIYYNEFEIGKENSHANKSINYYK